MGTYVVNSKKEQQELLTRCGLNSFVDLYKDIPEEVLLKDGLNLPKGLAELEVKRKFEDLADKNTRPWEQDSVYGYTKSEAFQKFLDEHKLSNVESALRVEYLIHQSSEIMRDKLKKFVYENWNNSNI